MVGTTPWIEFLQNRLVEAAVQNDVYYFVRVRWTQDVGGGVVQVYTKKRDLLRTVLRLRDSYSAYCHRPYFVESVVVIDVTMRNPHIAYQRIKSSSKMQ